MINKRLTTVFLSLIFTCTFCVLMASAENVLFKKPTQAQQEGRATDVRSQRLMPPKGLKRSDNNLTSFTGRVLAYRRGATSTTLRMRTDEETTERFTLRYAKKDGPAKWFLLRAEPFKLEDWAVIESRNVMASEASASTAINFRFIKFPPNG